MSASEKKLLVNLALLCMVIAAVDAKAVTKRDVEPINYFERLLEDLDNLKNIPLFGGILNPFITNIYKTIESVDKWSDGSLSNFVNSIFPCEMNGPLIRCMGTLDRNSLHKFILKIIEVLPVGHSVVPMLEFATRMMA